VVADLGSAREVGGVDLTMAAFAFGFPRALDVDTSLDGVSWTRAWSGPTDRLVVQGALADPGNVPLRIGIDRQSARYVRLRQTGAWEFAPWWIAELAVHAPLAP
jgi:hypothetical protein